LVSPDFVVWVGRTALVAKQGSSRKRALILPLFLAAVPANGSVWCELRHVLENEESPADCEVLSTMLMLFPGEFILIYKGIFVLHTRTFTMSRDALESSKQGREWFGKVVLVAAGTTPMLLAGC
jgi:hypothetical protein